MKIQHKEPVFVEIQPLFSLLELPTFEKDYDLGQQGRWNERETKTIVK